MGPKVTPGLVFRSLLINLGASLTCHIDSTRFTACLLKPGSLSVRRVSGQSTQVESSVGIDTVDKTIKVCCEPLRAKLNKPGDRGA